MQGTPVHVYAVMTQWTEGFYVPVDGARGASLQFFDSDGIAVDKLFLSAGQEPAEVWIKSQQHRNQKPDFEWFRGRVTAYSGNEASEVDHELSMKKMECIG